MSHDEDPDYFGEDLEEMGREIAELEPVSTIVKLDKPHPIFIPKPDDTRVEESIALAVRSMEEELEHFDAVMDVTTEVRKNVISKLATVVDGIQSVDLSDSDNVNNTLSIMNVTLKALADHETSATKRIGAKRAFENQRRGSAASAAIVDMFKSIAADRGSLATLDLKQDETVLEAEFSEDQNPILTTELNDDPQDLDEK